MGIDNMCHDDHTWSYSFPKPTIGTRILPLLERSIGNGSTGNQNIIIDQHSVWYINRKSEDSELVEHCNSKLCEDAHGYHIWDVGWGFHGILPPDVPLDWGFVEKVYDSSKSVDPHIYTHKYHHIYILDSGNSHLNCRLVTNPCLLIYTNK